jgi:hypothetical protein
MADVLVEFVRPVLELAPGPLTAQRLRTLLHTATACWNAAVHEQRPDSPASVASLREFHDGLSRAPSGVRGMTDALLARKRELFAHDQRLVASVEVKDENGELRVVALSERLEGPPAEA